MQYFHLFILELILDEYHRDDSETQLCSQGPPGLAGAKGERVFQFVMCILQTVVSICQCVIISLSVIREGEEMLEKGEPQDQMDRKETK